MIRLPILLSKEGLVVDVNPALQNPKAYPVVLFQSGIKDIWDELDGQDFFGSRRVIFPDGHAREAYRELGGQPVGIYTEKDNPRLDFQYSAYLWLYLSPQGEWEIKKLIRTISDPDPYKTARQKAKAANFAPQP